MEPEKTEIPPRPYPNRDPPAIQRAPIESKTAPPFAPDLEISPRAMNIRRSALPAVTELCARYCSEAMDDPKVGRTLHRGSTRAEGGDFRLQCGELPGALCAEDMCDQLYRVVFIFERENTIATYCEGDITVEVYWEKDAFVRAVREAREFYQHH